jgi:neurotransmitter:Na+ symporter, NSS family
MANNNKITDQWSGKWAFILAATGAAVGLGNIWRFPYLAGQYGGSAFFVTYLICLVLLGMPILIAEILIGRHARANPVDALQQLAVQHQNSRYWGLLGWWGALALILILSFYSVVSGWSIAYLLHSLSASPLATNHASSVKLWSTLMASPWQLLLWHSVFMLLTMGVILLGVQQGLERMTKFVMPALYLILFILVIYAAHIGYFKQAWHYLFAFKPSLITSKTIIAALGQAFFTLAVGAGAMLTYGAYAPRNISIPFAVLTITVLDVLVAVLSGLAIFPLVFRFHLAIDSGPNLMYITLPTAFSHMAYGNLIAALFFILLFFTAWTSSINLAEPLILILKQKFNFTRTRAVIIIGSIAWLLGIGSILSFNVWRHVLIFKHSFFDLITNIPTNFLLPLGALGFAIFAGWVLPKNVTESEINSRIYPIWRFLTRYVAPILIIIVLLDAWT